MLVDYKEYMSTRKLTELRKATVEDQEIQAVLRLVRRGWPEHKSEVPNLALPYFTFN